MLFDRDYVPICQRYRGKEAQPADPTECVQRVMQEFFYDEDGTPESELRMAAENALRDRNYLDQCMAEMNRNTCRCHYRLRLARS